MDIKIVEMLHLRLEPVGIFLGNTSAKCELEASPMLKEGERFFCDAEVAMKWRNNMPYKLWENMMQDLDKSCLTTHSWRKIEERL